ncbi:NAD(P)-binding protein, partial [Wilcoxina mikolae CBS 423.85]
MPGDLMGGSFYHFGRKDGNEEELRDWVENADAVFCCTPAKEPLFPMQWVTEDTYVSLVGSYTPDMVEVEPELLKREGVTVVVDSVEACLKEAGELIQGGLGRDDVVELGTVLAKGEAVTGICVFKCVGMGLMDLVVGREVVRIAEEAGIGVKVEGF